MVALAAAADELSDGDEDFYSILGVVSRSAGGCCVSLRRREGVSLHACHTPVAASAA